MEVLLLQGIEFTTRLQLLVSQNMNFLFGDGWFEESASDLTNKIHQCFTDALSLLNTTTNSGGVQTILSSHETIIRDHKSTSMTPVITGNSSFSNSDDWKSSCSSSKAISGSSTDGKTGYKKRKTTLQTWDTVTPIPVYDGHVWRKYGQKEVHNSEFRRSYYRCTHRNEQGCQATKQVQQTQDKPSMYKTTYMGHHTCKPAASYLDSVPDLMLDQSHGSGSGSACVINFQTNLTTKQSNVTFSTPSFPTPVHTNEELKPIATVHDQYPLNKQPITTSHDQFPLNNITPVTDDNDFTMSEFLFSADLSVFDSISKEVSEIMGIGLDTTPTY